MLLRLCGGRWEKPIRDFIGKMGHFRSKQVVGLLGIMADVYSLISLLYDKRHTVRAFSKCILLLSLVLRRRQERRSLIDILALHIPFHLRHDRRTQLAGFLGDIFRFAFLHFSMQKCRSVWMWKPLPCLWMNPFRHPIVPHHSEPLTFLLV